MSLRIAGPTAQLVEKARDPAAPLHEQHAAFAQLVEQSQHLVFGIALASLCEVEDARDAAQDAFLTAWLRLGQLRDASLFSAWLRKIVTTQCSRSLRRRTRSRESELPETMEADSRRVDYGSLLTDALAALPAGERDVTVLFYFLGYSQTQIGRLLRLKPGTVGKRLHSARLRIRRRLPPSVRGDILRLTPSTSFVQQVRLGLFDEYVGEYRFDRRPEHVVSISREGQSLISRASGQRHVLSSGAEDSLLTCLYDGEGRFHRDRRGKITHFVYYEFGKRLGIARRMDRRE
ncbi:MAG TPA: sigma-70 family RNA polymerase sigma factor [Gemmatimonadales bacterium]|nr:sigma-70 family RNA polymerase sigma factor [Gemmatimonadales bacterium]